MNRALAAVVTAFSYFSILPVRGRVALPAPDSAALVAVPLVGAVLGALSGVAASLVSRVAPREYVVATAFAAPILLSGALHVDGFLDCSDAVFASAEPARRLDILKDPNHGTYAVAGFAILVTFWLAALARCRPARLPAILAFSGALARLAAVANVTSLPDARAGSAPRAFDAPPSRLPLAAQAFVLIALSRAIAPDAWLTVPAAFLASRCVARAVAARFGGGLTGDAYGFLIVLLEPAIVAAVAALDRTARR